MQPLGNLSTWTSAPLHPHPPGNTVEDPSPDRTVTVWRSATNVPVGMSECGRIRDVPIGARIACLEQNNHEYRPWGDWIPRSAVPLIPSQEECGTICRTNRRIWPSTWLSTRTHNPLVAGSSPAGPTLQIRLLLRSKCPISPGQELHRVVCPNG